MATYHATDHLLLSHLPSYFTYRPPTYRPAYMYLPTPTSWYLLPAGQGAGHPAHPPAVCWAQRRALARRGCRRGQRRAKRAFMRGMLAVESEYSVLLPRYFASISQTLNWENQEVPRACPVRPGTNGGTRRAASDLEPPRLLKRRSLCWRTKHQPERWLVTTIVKGFSGSTRGE